jgi:hypothetical protein
MMIFPVSTAGGCGPAQPTTTTNLPVSTYTTTILTSTTKTAPTLTTTTSLTNLPEIPIPQVMGNELLYDNGINAGMTGRFPYYGYAVLFTPPSLPYEVKQIKVCCQFFYPVTIDTSEAVVEIWDKNLKVLWHTKISESDYSVKGDWLYINAGVPVTGGFYAVLYTNAIQRDNQAYGMLLYYSTQDKNYASIIITDKRTIHSWLVDSLPDRLTTNWMIRVIGE